jgi:hypothetical protein
MTNMYDDDANDDNDDNDDNDGICNMHLFQSTLQYYFGIFNITCNVYLIYEFN